MNDLAETETILQFGAGNFLRAFVDRFIDFANRSTQSAVGKVVVVQSTGSQRADAINRAHGSYHVVLRGYRDGAIVDETESVSSISRALYAGTQWREVLTFARSAQLRWIFSNTTEAGFCLNRADDIYLPNRPPVSFPAKLLAVLRARYHAQESPVSIFPCELIEDNASRLRQLVLEQASRWELPEEERGWIANDCHWVSSLVDSIVPGAPDEHPLKDTDPLLLSAEPFASWVLETREPFIEHPDIQLTDDLTPYQLRKVRILNGAHTALVAYTRDKSVETVRECLDDPEIGDWLKRVIFDEIVPVLEGRVDSPETFARETLERFQNPFLEHRLSAIALNHEAKVKTRLLPTVREFEATFGHLPPLLSEALGDCLAAEVSVSS